MNKDPGMYTGEGRGLVLSLNTCEFFYCYGVVLGWGFFFKEMIVVFVKRLRENMNLICHVSILSNFKISEYLVTPNYMLVHLHPCQLVHIVFKRLRNSNRLG